MLANNQRQTKCGISFAVSFTVKRGFPRQQGRRRGGRVVEGARLERVYTGNRIEGSNPSLSASIIVFIDFFAVFPPLS